MQQALLKQGVDKDREESRGEKEIRGLRKEGRNETITIHKHKQN